MLCTGVVSCGSVRRLICVAFDGGNTMSSSVLMSVSAASAGVMPVAISTAETAACND